VAARPDASASWQCLPAEGAQARLHADSCASAHTTEARCRRRTRQAHHALANTSMTRSPDGASSVVEIYTDGACRGNPGPGGWAALLSFGEREKELAGAEAHTTNNRMELTAVIRALEALKRPVKARVFTDSEYVRRGISEWVHAWKARGWKTADRKPVKNQD